MKRFIITVLGLSLMAPLGIGCGDDASTQADAPPAGDPDMPALGGDQLDRAGRPAIATALQASFVGDPEMQRMAKDDYNLNTDPSTWNQYVGAANPMAPGTGLPGSGFVGSLAILESLNAACGDNALGNLGTPDAPRYSALAGLLAGDMLYVNSASNTCESYLAVEATALGLVDLSGDCGGRTLAFDVIDASYNALALGLLDGQVTDGVDLADTDVQPSDMFPFLGDPH